MAEQPTVVLAMIGIAAMAVYLLRPNTVVIAVAYTSHGWNILVKSKRLTCSVINTMSVIATRYVMAALTATLTSMLLERRAKYEVLLIQLWPNLNAARETSQVYGFAYIVWA